MSLSRIEGCRGVSLIEVVIALTILSVVLISLSGMMFQMGRHTRRAGSIASRTAAVESAVSWSQAIRYDSLNAVVGCVADTAGLLPYTRCVDVQTAGPGMRTVRIVIAPAGPLALAAETVTVQRNRPKQHSTLYVP